MTENRIESAVRRIELALGRIANVADHLPPAADSDENHHNQSLIADHQELREKVATTIEELDQLIEELET